MRRFTAILLALIFILVGCTQYRFVPWPIKPTEDRGEWDQYFDYGSGVANDPYLLTSTDDLESLASLITEDNGFEGVVFQVSDMDLGSDFTPIGNGETPFNGIFQGPSNSNRANITLSINEDSDDCTGLFGGLGEGAEVRYLNLTGDVSSTVNGGRVGMIAGIISNGAIIEDCSVSGTVSGNRVGGIVGAIILGGQVRNAENNAIITGVNQGGVVYAGGIAGTVNGENSAVISSVNKGNVSSESTRVGGIAGEAAVNSLIQDCENTATISGGGATGGIVGQTTRGAIVSGCINNGQVNATSGTQIGGISGGLGTGTEGTSSIVNCENNGPVNAPNSNQVGGIVGDSAGHIKDSVNLGDVTGNDSVGGVAGQMTKNSTISTTSDKEMNQGNIQGRTYVGGIVGTVTSAVLGNSTDNIGTITNSGEISGKNHVGGIAGQVSNNGNVYHVANTGIVEASNDGANAYAGGIAGYLFENGNLYYSSNSGDVSANASTGTIAAGGIIGQSGHNTSSGPNVISNSTNSGNVTSTGTAGGIAGIIRQMPTDFITASASSGSITGATTGSFIGQAIGNINLRFVECTIGNNAINNENPITTGNGQGIGTTYGNITFSYE